MVRRGRRMQEGITLMTARDLFRRRRHGLHVADAITENPQPADYAPANFTPETQPLHPWVRAEMNRIAAEAGRERLADEHARWYGWSGPDTDTLRRVADRLRAIPADPPPYRWTVAEDIRHLPVLRSTIRARARFHHAACPCEPADTGESAGWLASQYAEATAKPALSWWTLRVPPAEPVQSDDTLTWGRVAA